MISDKQSHAIMCLRITVEIPPKLAQAHEGLSLQISSRILDRFLSEYQQIEDYLLFFPITKDCTNIRPITTKPLDQRILNSASCRRQKFSSTLSFWDALYMQICELAYDVYVEMSNLIG